MVIFYALIIGLAIRVVWMGLIIKHVSEPSDVQSAFIDLGLHRLEKIWWDAQICGVLRTLLVVVALLRRYGRRAASQLQLRPPLRPLVRPELRVLRQGGSAQKLTVFHETAVSYFRFKYPSSTTLDCVSYTKVFR